MWGRTRSQPQDITLVYDLRRQLKTAESSDMLDRARKDVETRILKMEEAFRGIGWPLPK